MLPHQNRAQVLSPTFRTRVLTAHESLTRLVEKNSTSKELWEAKLDIRMILKDLEVYRRIQTSQMQKTESQLVELDASSNQTPSALELEQNKSFKTAPKKASDINETTPKRGLTGLHFGAGLNRFLNFKKKESKDSLFNHCGSIAEEKLRDIDENKEDQLDVQQYPKGWDFLAETGEFMKIDSVLTEKIPATYGEFREIIENRNRFLSRTLLTEGRLFENRRDSQKISHAEVRFLLFLKNTEINLEKCSKKEKREELINYLSWLMDIAGFIDPDVNPPSTLRQVLQRFRIFFNRVSKRFPKTTKVEVPSGRRQSRNWFSRLRKLLSFKKKQREVPLFKRCDSNIEDKLQEVDEMIEEFKKLNDGEPGEIGLEKEDSEDSLLDRNVSDAQDPKKASYDLLVELLKEEPGEFTFAPYMAKLPSKLLEEVQKIEELIKKSE